MYTRSHQSNRSHTVCFLLFMDVKFSMVIRELHGIREKHMHSAEAFS